MGHRQRDFLTLWFGQSVSQFGSQVTLIALPLTALLVLRASPFEVGLLGALGGVSYVGFGLLAGVLVDRVARKPLAILCDLGRFVLLGIVPVLALTGQLNLIDLYTIAFLSGTFTVLFEVAYRTLLPSLVPRNQLVVANSRLETTYAASQIAGPALGGGMVQLLTAPAAVAVDAVSFLVSAASLFFIRSRETTVQGRTSLSIRQLLREIHEGLVFVWANPFLRAFAYCSALWNAALNVILAEFLVFATNSLSLTPSASGLVLAGIGVGAFWGAIGSPRLVRRFGLGRVLIGAPAIAAVGSIAFPIAYGPSWILVPVLAFGWVLFGFGEMVFGVQMVSVRQMVTPDRMLGRMDATMRLFFRGAIPVGAVIGGVVAQQMGPRTAMALGAAGFGLTVVVLGMSRLRTLTFADLESHLAVAAET